MTPQPGRFSIWQILLGSFIVLELALMFVESGLSFLELAWPASADKLAPVRAIPRNYGRLTGQPQNWRMFSPIPPMQTAFPTVELYAAGSDQPYATLPDPLRPADLDAYFLNYGPGDRLCRYQAEMTFNLLLYELPVMAERPKDCRDYVAYKIREQWRMIRAYMHWRAARVPGTPEPDAMILAAEVYVVPPPDQPWHWPPPVRRLYARWDKALEGSQEWLPIEAFDPIEQRFRRLPIDGPLGWD